MSVDKEKCLFEFDIHTKNTVSDCHLRPTDVWQSGKRKLYARNNKYPEECVDPEKVGKWMLFPSRNGVDGIWRKIKTDVASGELWRSHVSCDPKKGSHRYAIMIKTKDYTDLSDVIRVLNYIESSGMIQTGEIIRYKTDEQTHARIYKGGSMRPWIYFSDTIRNKELTTSQAPTPKGAPISD